MKVPSSRFRRPNERTEVAQDVRYPSLEAGCRVDVEMRYPHLADANSVIVAMGKSETELLGPRRWTTCLVSISASARRKDLRQQEKVVGGVREGPVARRMG